ncbi:MAG: holo-ACP synthase [Eggerthellaceae bacterium]|nr:holo-ACP synthase [Eggerthellaceae bacterium]
MADENQVGLGIDVVDIARIEAIIARTPAFLSIFSDEEREYCDAKTRPGVHYACRFAAREAVCKALGTGFAFGIRPQDITVSRTSTGRPVAHLSGRAAEVARELEVLELPISLSYTHTEAVACAMAITKGSKTAEALRKDPMEELAKQFKSARAMLDTL